MTDIFNLSNVNDLPKTLELKNYISRPAILKQQLLSLFEIKKTLTLNEIMVGMFRKYNLEMKRTNLTAYLYYLTYKSKILKKTGIGTFTKI